MDSRERAMDWLSETGDDDHDQQVYTLTALLNQHAAEAKAEQREACGDDVYNLLSIQSNSPHWPQLAKEACLNAVEKSDG